MYKQLILNKILERLAEPRRFIQVIAGPRQCGKTTLIRQAIDKISESIHYASADGPTLQDHVWIEHQWALAHLKAKESGSAILVLDEVQKIAHWLNVIKKLWDKDTFDKNNIKLVVLGSAPLLIQKGLTESLAGRFETIHVPHWSYKEMKDAFNFDLNQYIYFGGYPGAAGLIADILRWSSYIMDAIIEPTISRDILLLNRVDKPALLRRLFQLGTDYSGQILSFQKMLGQLQDAGNTTTLAHYLELLSGAGMLSGISKFSTKKVLQRASSPKLNIHNTALMSASKGLSLDEAINDRDYWGRLVESAVGAHIINSSAGTGIENFYWRERGEEVDFVIRSGKKLAAFEVKSGRKDTFMPGMKTFVKQFKPDVFLMIGGDGIELEEFFMRPIDYWIK